MRTAPDCPSRLQLGKCGAAGPTNGPKDHIYVPGGNGGCGGCGGGGVIVEPDVATAVVVVVVQADVVAAKP
jgi:hypothetical protein